MATPRTIRRLAFQALYQFDAVPDSETRTVRASIDIGGDIKPVRVDKALNLARDAYEHRAERRRGDLKARPRVARAPPARGRSSPAADLAYYEMTRGTTPPKAAVAEAVKLAREFSTEKSPAFINAILDKLLKQVLADVSGTQANPTINGAQA